MLTWADDIFGEINTRRTNAKQDRLLVEGKVAPIIANEF